MMRAFVYAIGMCVVSALLANTSEAETKNVTWTGWFSDSKCASARAAAGTFSATNPDCAKSCIEKGATPVLVSEAARALFKVKDYPHVIDDLGYHVEITASVDEPAGTISIQKVKRLSYEGAACTRPKKAGAKQ